LTKTGVFAIFIKLGAHIELKREPR